MVVFTGVDLEQLQSFAKKEKFFELKTRTIYEQLRLQRGVKKKVLLILYSSKKLLLQGDDDVVETIRKKLISAKIGSYVTPIKFVKESGWVIGSDESLKGDTFGGIVVAAVRANDAQRETLRSLGVADSKKLDDKEIVLLAKEIRKLTNCVVFNLYPEEYNLAGSVTTLLNRLHKEAAQELGNGVHVVDKYPGCSVGDVRETKAESKYLEVAAASILARAAALEQLNQLSKLLHFPAPKGSTHVKWALEDLSAKELDPSKFVKMHFRNVKAFFG